MHKFKLEEKFKPGRVLVEVAYTDADMKTITDIKVKAALLDKLNDRWDLEIVRSRRSNRKTVRG